MTVEELVTANHDQALEQKDGHVCQIWEDGEITLQKSGDLLWQRNLHSIIPGKTGLNIPMPIKIENHSYACVTSVEVAHQIRALMGDRDVFDD